MKHGHEQQISLDYHNKRRQPSLNHPTRGRKAILFKDSLIHSVVVAETLSKTYDTLRVRSRDLLFLHF